MISNSVWNEIGSCPLGSSGSSFVLLNGRVSFQIGAGGQRPHASSFVWDRRKVNDYCCWCLLLFWTSGKKEGDYLVPLSPLGMGKWIVRERSVEPHLRLDSSISLFIFPYTWPGQPAKSMHMCEHEYVWSVDALQTGNAFSLNFNKYSV